MGDNEVVSVCDTNLVGKTFTEGELELKVSEQFYKGEEKTVEEVSELIKEAKNLNLVGEESINLAEKIGILEKDNVLVIDGIPHAQLFQI
ncbi:DUF424 family protein [archaeon]|nr:DUF424 family protein [archaeon]